MSGMRSHRKPNTGSPTAGQMVRRQPRMFVIPFRVPFHPACIHLTLLSPHTITNSAELKYGEYIKQPNRSKTDACDSEGAVMSAPLRRTQSQNMIRTGSEAGAITLARGCSICVIGWERSETKPFRTSTQSKRLGTEMRFVSLQGTVQKILKNGDVNGMNRFTGNKIKADMLLCGIA